MLSELDLATAGVNTRGLHKHYITHAMDNDNTSIVGVLVFCNVTNKIRKRTDTAVAFTHEYSRVSYPLGNVM